METYEIVSCLISAIGVLVSTIVAIFTYKNLQEIKTQNFEQNRGNINLYIEKSKYNNFYYIIIKNFGNNSALLKSIEITPPITWNNTKYPSLKDFDIKRFQNICLAPDQSVQTEFDFSDYKHSQFHVVLTYTTLNKEFIIAQDIDLQYMHKIIYKQTDAKKELDALNNITHSIEELSERFR